jgi:O-antigen ligase
MIDSEADPSARWRDLENYDLYYTLRSNPVLGTGFGHGYVEIIPLPDISQKFEMYRFSPHNSLLGLFAFAGLVGFAGIWMMFPLGVFFAVRSYRFAATAGDRCTSLVALGILVVFVVHSYGDIGLGNPTALFTVAPTLAFIAKQAVATGAWSTRGPSAVPRARVAETA